MHTLSWKVMHGRTLALNSCSSVKFPDVYRFLNAARNDVRVCSRLSGSERWSRSSLPWRRGASRAVGVIMIPLERATLVSYRCPIVTIVLSMTIRPQFVIECLRRSIF